jgi:ABC-2 type transport system ATP-binding protein
VNPAICVRGLVKRYDGDVLAVNGLDLRVEPGECFGLLGPNGAGKTTTIEILEGLLEPTAGEVELLGLSWKNHEASLRQRIGISLQETRLEDRLTVEETLRLFRSFYRRGPSVEELLERVSLTEKRSTWYEKLSGGQKQRLAVACALAGDPELLFLDEPTTGLDPQSRRQLWEVVEQLRSCGRSVLLTTHYMDEAERLCDRVAVVDHGKIIAEGTPRELINQYVGCDVIQFSIADGKRPGLDALTALAAVRQASLHGEAFALTVDALQHALPALVAHLATEGLVATELSTHRASLEDVFVHLTGRHLRD